ncbi:MAG TPA: phosphoenolpyruvate--protein phosphotransferase [Myxococcota bacterium]
MREGPDTAVLDGVAAAPGIAIGRARVLQRAPLVVPERHVPPGERGAEIARLAAAAARARARLEPLLRAVAGVELVEAVLRTQLLMLEDRQLLEDAARRIRDEGINAELALRREGDRLLALFGAMRDPYLRERRADVEFAVRELLTSLLGGEPDGVGPLGEPTVVVAEDLSAPEVARLDRAHVVGLATAAGGRASHAAILARSLGLPAVVGLGDATRAIGEGDLVVVDGRAGRVVVRPPEATVRRSLERARAERRRASELLRGADLPAETRDGRPVALRANLESLEELPSLRRHGATGVGLYRTEFLFLNRSEPPGEDEQERHYRALLAGVAPWPATIRTLDLGGDKLPGSLPRRADANPALGLRGVRLARGPGGLYEVQLRALLRASPAGRLRVLLPLVSGVEEVVALRARLADLRSALEAEGCPVADDIELGVVVETPAAAALIDLLAPEVAFFSIGTNDLTQYTVAVDRENEAVAYLYEAGHPAVLRAIRSAVEVARAAGRPIGVCGEMAGDPLYTLVLVGLGVDELSMNAASVPLVKRILRATEWADARDLAGEALGLRTAAEVADLLRKEMRRRFPEPFEAV